MQAPFDALNTLKAGNEQFVNGVRESEAVTSPVDRAAMSGAQQPIAVVISCSDSRVPAEMVFNQGFGALFVVRVAGNVVGPTQLGSVEFAVQNFGCQLIVVMGHTGCGAIKATIDMLRNPEATISDNLQSIVDPIRAAIAPIVNPDANADALMPQAIRANVHSAVDQLREGSVILNDIVAAGQLMIVGAEYSLETGVVEFIDDTAA